MSAGYALAYRLGVTPWERAGTAGAAQLGHLLDREEAERSGPLGRAVDLGCGSGPHTVELAERGWSATGIDNIERAVGRARRRAGAHEVRFVVGDVTALAAAGVGTDVDFFLDVGCFHGLGDEERRRYGHGVTAASAEGATLLMLCFRPGHRLVLPRGASRADVETALPDWTVIAEEAADTSGLPGPLKKTAPWWYRLRRG